MNRIIEVPRSKVTVDFSDNPIREMLLIAVLSEMVKATITQNGEQIPTQNSTSRGTGDAPLR